MDQKGRLCHFSMSLWLGSLIWPFLCQHHIFTSFRISHIHTSFTPCTQGSRIYARTTPTSNPQMLFWRKVFGKWLDHRGWALVNINNDFLTGYEASSLPNHVRIYWEDSYLQARRDPSRHWLCTDFESLGFQIELWKLRTHGYLRPQKILPDLGFLKENTYAKAFLKENYGPKFCFLPRGVQAPHSLVSNEGWSRRQSPDQGGKQDLGPAANARGRRSFYCYSSLRWYSVKKLS